MKVTLYMAMSANGMVATGQGETPWGEASWHNYVNAANRFGCMIVGANTYQAMKRDDDFKNFKEEVFVVVVTKSDHPADDNVCFVDSPAAALDVLRSLDKTEVLLGGGPGLFTSVLEENLVDEVWLDVEPIIIGQGLDLVSKELIRNLKPLAVEEYEGGVTLKYATEKSA